jgi:hypothetical protein
VKPKPKLTLEQAAEDNPALARLLEYRRRPEPDKISLEFYTVLVFQSNEQCAEFWSKLPSVPTAYRGQYADGTKLAEALGIELTPCKFGPIRPEVDESMKAMAMGAD